MKNPTPKEIKKEDMRWMKKLLKTNREAQREIIEELAELKIREKNLIREIEK